MNTKILHNSKTTQTNPLTQITWCSNIIMREHMGEKHSKLHKFQLNHLKACKLRGSRKTHMRNLQFNALTINCNNIIDVYRPHIYTLACRLPREMTRQSCC